VVEDNEINALLSRALLTRLGHRPTVATNGAAALETWQAARAAGTPYELVLMDAQMPVMGGLKADSNLLGRKPQPGSRLCRSGRSLAMHSRGPRSSACVPV
jgi:CheY-like chemotaxis protein